MSRAASLKACADCGRLSRSFRCSTHRNRAQEANRRAQAQKPWAFVYKTAEWARARKFILERDPTCVECNQAPSTSVDHIIPLRKLWNGQGFNQSPYDQDNLRGLCVSCHARITEGFKGGV